MGSDQLWPGGEALAIALRVVRILESLGARAWIGGSLASSAFGIPRATQDADIVADLSVEAVPELIARLGGEFYADEERISQGVVKRTSFNVIHLPTMFKVDVFLLQDSPWARRQLERVRTLELPEPGIHIPLTSPEDIILHKLLWFREGNRVSDRQWRDGLGVVQVQAGQLDLEYLVATARELELTDLLDELLAEGLSPPPRT
jgi:hypothetical protein